jgi:hypothetical protein
MNVTFNSDTIAMLVNEIDDMLCNADISAGTCDDLSSFLNGLMEISRAGSIVIIPNDDNIGDDWDDWESGPDDGPDGQPVPTGWDVADT